MELSVKGINYSPIFKTLSQRNRSKNYQTAIKSQYKIEQSLFIPLQNSYSLDPSAESNNLSYRSLDKLAKVRSVCEFLSQRKLSKLHRTATKEIGL